MASAESQFIGNLAQKLGLDETTTLKGKEYLRVLHNKSGSLRLNVNDVAKAVICLDLASKVMGTTFDQEVALQLSRLKIKIYSSHLNMIEKVLGLDKPLTISEVCVQFSCTELKEFSENILKKYEETFSHADVAHPQYVAMAVWSASKMKSIKISKQNMISISRLKPGQWKELEQKFNAFLAGTKISNTSEKGVRKKERNMADCIENYAINKENQEATSSKNVKYEDKNDEEDYEVWKERILKEAYEKIRKQNS